LRAAQALALSCALIERGRELQLRGQAQMAIARMAIARSQHLLEPRAGNDPKADMGLKCAIQRYCA